MAYAAQWVMVFLLSTAACIGIGGYLEPENVPPETVAALVLLTVNALFFVAAAAFPHWGPPWSHPNLGLAWVMLKLFVNTFTIFLFIGLQAGRTHVFICQFFGAYLVLLPGSILLLSRQP